MVYSSVLTLIFGGLGLFLFALSSLSEEMKKFAHNEKIKSFILKITKNKFKSFSIGVLFTAFIQSNSCASVMFLNLAESNLLTISSCIAAIIGANLGTCMTSILVSISSFSVTKVMPYLLFLLSLGLILTKKPNVRKVIKILLVFSLIFFAISTINIGIKNILSLQDSSDIANVADFLFSHRILGFLFGLFVTAIFQSSSVVIAVIQVVCGSAFSFKYLSFVNVFPIIIGVNVGTMMPLLLMTINNKTLLARRITFINFVIRMTVAVFYILLLLFFSGLLQKIELPFGIMAQISLMHIMFKSTMALFFLPIIEKLYDFSKKVVKEQEETKVEQTTSQEEIKIEQSTTKLN